MVKITRLPTEAASISQALLAKLLQYTLAQKIRIALTCPRKLDDPPRDYFIGEVTSACKSKGDASHFECDPHDPLGFGIPATSRSSACPHMR
ncbi:MAG TPA: hypothetical protein VEN78_01840 [Bradyrhizobium sp.]|nr:hypothetical protein [Bradyrhizobium sp.]